MNTDTHDCRYCSALALNDERVYDVLREMHAQITAVQGAVALAVAQYQPVRTDTVALAGRTLPLVAKRLMDILTSNK